MLDQELRIGTSRLAYNISKAARVDAGPQKVVQAIHGIRSALLRQLYLAVAVPKLGVCSIWSWYMPTYRYGDWQKVLWLSGPHM